MSQISEKHHNTVKRRVASITNHLIPSKPPQHITQIESSPTSLNDSYHRVHGSVSTKEVVWRDASDGFEFKDILYEKAVGEEIAKITINRPERRNAFRPQTVKEMIRAFDDARNDSSVGVIILTGKVIAEH